MSESKIHIGLVGATGFVGRNILECLSSIDNYHFYCLVRSENNKAKISGLFDHVKLLELDQFCEGVHDIFDVVINVSTQYDNKTSSNFSEIYACNYDLPLKLLQSTSVNRQTKFINFDTFTSKIIGYPYLPIYHGTKRMCRELSKLYCETQNNNVTFFNIILHHVYGNHDKQTKFIPFLIDQFTKNVPSLDLTSGIQKRDFIYVKDVCSFIDMLINESSLSGFTELELGTGNSHSVKEMVELIKSLVGDNDTELNFGKLPMRDHELLDSKAERALPEGISWKNQYTFNEGFKEYIKFIRT